MSSAEIDEVITRAESKNTKDNTKWAIQVFEGKFNAVKCNKFRVQCYKLKHC